MEDIEFHSGKFILHPGHSPEPRKALEEGGASYALESSFWHY